MVLGYHKVLFSSKLAELTSTTIALQEAQTAYRTLMIVEGIPLQVPAPGTDLYNLLEEWQSMSAQRYNLTYSLSSAIEVTFVGT